MLLPSKDIVKSSRLSYLSRRSVMLSISCGIYMYAVNTLTFGRLCNLATTNQMYKTMDPII